MKKIILISILLTLVATSCSNKPIIGSKENPFVVDEIFRIDNEFSEYYSVNSNTSISTRKGCVVLPSKMFNIGDTIKPEHFIKNIDTIIVAK